MTTQRESGIHHGYDDDHDLDTQLTDEQYHRDARRGGVYDESNRPAQRDTHGRISAERNKQWGYRNLTGGFSRGGESGDNGRYPNTGEGYSPRSGKDGGHDSEDLLYKSWREKQIRMLDEEYEAYRRENQDRFNSEFESWRNRRALSARSLRAHPVTKQ